ncbi:MAG: putative entry exclusion protein TrbK-alt [Alphaproteobacteria bacterium]|nr:putative entry exclusion protein TrbK-alt [Alphaproteobacteria bacterium]
MARAASYAAVAAAIAATAFHVRHQHVGAPATSHPAFPSSDPLAAELAHCQAIGATAKDDPACQAVWAANRRRFFGDHPSKIATDGQPTSSKPATKFEHP